MDLMHIYGEFSEDGEFPSYVDACSRHTHDIDGTSIYHYHLQHVKYLRTIGCFKGCPEVSNSPLQLQFTSTVWMQSLKEFKLP